jgi:anaerobic magnesium-protoporphyrin IX monomethyl ester cyclase
MRVMLIQPPTRSTIKALTGATSPPLGLAYIASKLEAEGHEVRIVDSLAMGYDLADLEGELRAFEPELVGVTATTPMIYDAYGVARLAKGVNPDCTVAVGGPHASFTAAETLSECGSIDVVVRGEGELTMAELASGEELSRIRGIAYRDDGRIRQTADRELVRDLDDLPPPAYHLLPMRRYRFRDVGFATMITSRGCPFGCIFCSSSKLMGKSWRGRSPEDVVEEMRLLSEGYGIREIEILDDTFTLNRRRAREICELIRRERLDVSWSCSSRVDTIDEATAREMRAAGCHSIYLGVESASQRSLNFLRKGISLAAARRALEMLRRLNFNTVASFIIGIPGETVKAIERTISFAKRLNPTFAQFSLLTPYPGTELYEYAREKGLLLTRDWSRYTVLDPVMRVPGLAARKLKWLLNKAYLSFYGRPLQVLKLIRFGGLSLLKPLFRLLPSRLTG